MVHAFCTASDAERRQAIADFLQGLVPSIKHLKHLQVQICPHPSHSKDNACAHIYCFILLTKRSMCIHKSFPCKVLEASMQLKGLDTEARLTDGVCDEQAYLEDNKASAVPHGINFTAATREALIVFTGNLQGKGKHTIDVK